MAPKVTVLKVCVNCDKCKTKLLKAVASLEGVNKIETDEEKGTLTVIGNVDPQEVIGKARKVGSASFVSVGDPKKPDDKPEPEKKPDDPCCCNICRPEYAVLPYNTFDPYPFQPTCSIM